MDNPGENDRQDQGDNDGRGEKLFDSAYILKLYSIKYLYRLDIRYKMKQRVQVTSRFLA